MTVLDPVRARELARRRGTPDERPHDADLLEAAIRTLWPDDEDLAAMRDILLPECILMLPAPEAWCGMDRKLTFCGKDGRLTPIRSQVSVEFSVITARRWPTCSDCQALLLELRDHMPEWWAVEEMTIGEAEDVALATPPFPDWIREKAAEVLQRSHEARS